LLLTFGDSKTWAGGWQGPLETELETETGQTWTSYNGGANSAALTIHAGNQGWAVNYLNVLDAQMLEAPTVQQARVIALINIGVNDFCCSGFNGAAWKTAMLTLIDRISQRWPDSEKYIAIPWSRGHDAEADAMSVLIDEVIIERPTVRRGPDERVWLKGADDGATMTSDGVHYSAAGNAQAPIEWMTSFGY
jgi:lysophospholipase L1-like esterase